MGGGRSSCPTSESTGPETEAEAANCTAVTEQWEAPHEFRQLPRSRPKSGDKGAIRAELREKHGVGKNWHTSAEARLRGHKEPDHPNLAPPPKRRKPSAGHGSLGEHPINLGRITGRGCEAIVGQQIPWSYRGS